MSTRGHPLSFFPLSPSQVLDLTQALAAASSTQLRGEGAASFRLMLATPHAALGSGAFAPVVLAQVWTGVAGSGMNWCCWLRYELVLLAQVWTGVAGSGINWCCWLGYELVLLAQV
jgi:hypothetical protein